jgi:DNA polymerase I-like protein with 3'-5' exonuclease and polymerase domains
MLSLVFDIETDSLKPTKIWCMTAQDSDSGETYKFAPHQLESGLELLKSADKLIGHNILGFDIPVIKKLLGIDLSNKILVDTLVLSRLFNPSREGGHSLAMWGYRLKYPKQNFEDFETYTPKMLEYCLRDVQINKLVLEALKKESKGFSRESVDLEHAVGLIMKEQEQNGFEFDKQQAEKLLAYFYKKMGGIEEKVHKVFKPRWVDDKEVRPYIKKDGTLSKRGMTDKEYKRVFAHQIYVPFMRKKLQAFNLSSRKQIGEYLQDFGWKPRKRTPTGLPMVNEKTLSSIKNIPEAKLIAEYLLLQKRIAQIESWIEAVEEDGRVHGFVIPNGTITGRMAHRKPNMAQVPSSKSPYGIECRACWTVPKGYKLIGIDASSLELRMLAHYMKDEEFTNEIINGDIHSRNQKIAGLQSRNQAKTFIYALLYGAGDAKIGSVVGGSKADGKKLRERFFANQPTFKTLRDRVTQAAKKDFIKGIDGRRIHIRNAHAALNSLLQGGGAIVMKRALIILNNKAKKRNLDYKFVANIHDEWQVEVHKAHAEYFGKLGIEAIKEAGEYYKMRCPLDAQYKIGEDWSETH